MTAARPAVQAVPLKENRFRAQLHQSLTAELTSGEELRWFGLVYQYKAPRFIVGLFAWSIVLPMIGPLIATILRRPWTVGVTSERVLFGYYQGHQGKRRPPPMIPVPRGDVTVLRTGRKTGKLILTTQVEGLPAKFTLFRGQVDEVEALFRT